jgi:threonine dehydratase
MFVPDFVHLQSMSGGTGLGTEMTHETSRRDVLAFNMGFGGLSGDGRVVKTGETAPTTISLTLQLSLDCSVNLSQAPGNKNYKKVQMFILEEKGF